MTKTLGALQVSAQCTLNFYFYCLFCFEDEYITLKYKCCIKNLGQGKKLRNCLILNLKITSVYSNLILLCKIVIIHNNRQ